MRGLLIAVTDPANSEQEGDYHHWYNNVQIPGFLAMTQILRVTRYRTSVAQVALSVPMPHQFAALYEIGVADMAGLAAFADLQFESYKRGLVGNYTPGAHAFNQTTSRGVYYAQVGDRTGPENLAPESVFMVFTDRPLEKEAQGDGLASGGAADVVATHYRLTDLNMGRQFKPWLVPRSYLSVYEFGCKGAEALALAERASTPRDRVATPALQNPDLSQLYECIAGPFIARRA